MIYLSISYCEKNVNNSLGIYLIFFIEVLGYLLKNIVVTMI